MATSFLSTANTFLSSGSSASSSSSSSSCSSSSLLTTPTSTYPQRHNAKRKLTLLCKAVTEPPPSSSSSSSSPSLSKRSLSVCLTATFLFSLAGKSGSDANAAILEADDDFELLDKVKKDRKKRLDKQVLISSSKKETGYLQEVVYKLSKVGQAIDNNDLPAASSVLGAKTDADWVKKANLAFTKLSSEPEEKNEVESFNSSLATLISSVIKNDAESSKLAFVSSATALEKWTALTGLVSQLKGL